MNRLFKYTFISLLAILSTINTYACLNYYVVDERGRSHIHDNYPPSHVYINPKITIEQLQWAEARINNTSDSSRYKYLSNYCVCLIKLGRNAEALPILEKLAADKPGEYEIIANLAVAYELNGQLDKALQYLKKSLEISPKSHNESEWIHQRILEYAIKVRDNKTGDLPNTILGVENDSAATIGEQITYQLKERVPLTPSSNELLSKVIEESADFYRKNISIEWAIELYAIAIGYSTDSKKNEQLWEQMTVLQQKLASLRTSKTIVRTSGYLLNKNWTKEIEKRIARWKNYKPYIYAGPLKPLVDFPVTTVARTE